MTGTMKARVEAFETITVPAGTFEAFRIRYVTTLSGIDDRVVSGDQLSWFGRAVDIGWYAPTVKWFVKGEREVWADRSYYDKSRYELTSFKPAAERVHQGPSGGESK